VPALDAGPVADDHAVARVPRPQRLPGGTNSAVADGQDRGSAAVADVDPTVEMRVVGAVVGVGRLQHEVGGAPFLRDVEGELRPLESEGRWRLTSSVFLSL